MQKYVYLLKPQIKLSFFNYFFLVFTYYFCNFAPMNTNVSNEKWKSNVILADADYLDSVAFNLTVNFERMIGRRIPQADFARWADCVALDGGLREGDNEIQVVLVHRKKNMEMKCFTPGEFATQLDGKAFKDNLGEFLISSLAIEDNLPSGNDLLIESLQVISNANEVKRLMVVAADEDYVKVKDTLRHADDDKRITVFSMQPMPGGNFRQEILGYSVMNALGIRSEELEGK